MATATRSRSKAIVVRRSSGPSPKIAKLQARVAAAGKRARSAAAAQESTLLTVGGAAGFAILQKKMNLPTVANLDPFLLYGALLTFGAPALVKGSTGAKLRSVGEGILGAGMARSVSRGTAQVSGYDDDEDEAHD